MQMQCNMMGVVDAFVVCIEQPLSMICQWREYNFGAWLVDD